MGSLPLARSAVAFFDGNIHNLFCEPPQGKPLIFCLLPNFRFETWENGEHHHGPTGHYFCRHSAREYAVRMCSIKEIKNQSRFYLLYGWGYSEVTATLFDRARHLEGFEANFYASKDEPMRRKVRAFAQHGNIDTIDYLSFCCNCPVHIFRLLKINDCEISIQGHAKPVMNDSQNRNDYLPWNIKRQEPHQI